MWLQDTGILSRLKYDVFKPPFYIPDPKVRHNQPLIIYQVGISFVILSGGIILSAVVFLFEVLKNTKNTKRGTHIQPSEEMEVTELD